MRHLLLLIFTASSLSITAQSLTPELVSSAGDFSQNGSSLEWSLGELSISEFNMLSEGFHQGNIQILSVDESDIKISIYPNPTTDQIIIESDQVFQKYTLHNINGKIVYEGILKQNRINCSYLSTGVYFLKIENNQYSLTNKIQKL